MEKKEVAAMKTAKILSQTPLTQSLEKVDALVKSHAAILSA